MGGHDHRRTMCYGIRTIVFHVFVVFPPYIPFNLCTLVVALVVEACITVCNKVDDCALFVKISAEKHS